MKCVNQYILFFVLLCESPGILECLLKSYKSVINFIDASYISIDACK